MTKGTAPGTAPRQLGTAPQGDRWDRSYIEGAVPTRAAPQESGTGVLIAPAASIPITLHTPPEKATMSRGSSSNSATCTP